MPIKPFKEKELNKDVNKEHHKDFKDHKDKPEKEKHEKDHKEVIKDIKDYQKEIEHPPQQQDLAATGAQVDLNKNPEKYFYPEKFKSEKLEKIEHWEHKPFAKDYFDKLKDIYESPGIPVQGDPVELASRVAMLEAAVGQLMHFIPASMRPDLSKGALKQEPAGEQTAQDKKEEKQG